MGRDYLWDNILYWKIIVGFELLVGDFLVIYINNFGLLSYKILKDINIEIYGNIIKFSD